MTLKSQWLTTANFHNLTDRDEGYGLALALLYVFLILEPEVIVEPPSQPRAPDEGAGPLIPPLTQGAWLRNQPRAFQRACMLSRFSLVPLFATLRTVSPQAPHNHFPTLGQCLS